MVLVQKADIAVEDLSPEDQAELQLIRDRKIKIVAEHRRKKSAANNHPLLPQKADRDRKSTTTNMKASPLPPEMQFSIRIALFLPSHCTQLRTTHSSTVNCSRTSKSSPRAFPTTAGQGHMETQATSCPVCLSGESWNIGFLEQAHWFCEIRAEESELDHNYPFLPDPWHAWLNESAEGRKSISLWPSAVLATEGPWVK